MITSTEFSLFIISSIVLIIAPGPDLIFLITQTLHRGRQAGLFIAMGLACGNLVHTLLVTFSVVLALQASEQALASIQYLGAGYLLYLAYRTIRSSRTEQENNTNPRRYRKAYFVRGLLMNILNPKVGLFFLAYLPQFIASDSPHPERTMILLGSLFTLLVMLVFSSLVIVTNQFKQHSVLRSLNHRYVNWFTASVLTLLASHLLLFN